MLEGLRAASGGDAHRRKEHELTTGGRRELRAATFGIAGFPEHLLAAQRNLVGADHDRIGAPTRNRERLCARESGGEPRRRFTVETRLIDLGCHAFKRHSEAFEQPAAMGGGGSQQQQRQVRVVHAVLRGARSLKNKGLSSGRL